MTAGKTDDGTRSLVREPIEVEAAPPAAPADPIRRVYALPPDLVERIVEFQKEKGYNSEVEAARRLLDDALKSRDTIDKIISRFMTRLGSLRIASEVAKDVLVGHPLIGKMEFDRDGVSFQMRDDSWEAVISDTGLVTLGKPGLSPFDPPHYYWKPRGEKFGPGSIERRKPDEDDIPF